MIDLRSDLMSPRSQRVAEAMRAAALRAPTMGYAEDADERALNQTLAAELGMEAVLLVPTCTMANQIAIRLHLPGGGQLASAANSHIVTVEARATALTGVARDRLPAEDGHPSPSTVIDYLSARAPGAATLVWLENTHMLSAGSVMPVGWQAQIGVACRAAGSPIHLDGSRLWNAAVARDAPLATLAAGCDTVAVSLNKAIGAPLGSVLAGSHGAIAEAVRWRDAMGGAWRPVSSIAAAALAALESWRERLEADMEITRALAKAIIERLGDQAVRPTPSNLVFLNRPAGDAVRFVAALERQGVRTISLSPGLVRLAIHCGMREPEVEVVAQAVSAAANELATELAP